ncbi:hypothetical protein ACOSP7_027593 [Xanthoceras sorbifolium]|uniref:Reticulon-like protein n=1 Tax=Xanthoceras sorbifolium TaxID=99658 RepID=A0ABQ8GZI0_9ROSI|nr:hypothetical protein JRO89_XSUnG0086300 [Xanthoceras sorbifolium]
MAEHATEHESAEKSLMEKISDKIHGGDDSSSSSDSETDKPSSVDTVKAKIFRLFGREQPVHKVLGGGKPADVFLWRNKKISASVLGGATAMWVFFELLEYHLITLVCHISILALAGLFLWANASTFINKSPPQIPVVSIPEKCVLEVASALRIEINCALAVLRDIASGKDLKKFLGVIAGLWVVSIVGSWCNFLTLFYIAFVLLHTVPVIYEKYEDQIDSFGEKATMEIKKQYKVFDEKVLSHVLAKIPKGPLKEKKKD